MGAKDNLLKKSENEREKYFDLETRINDNLLLINSAITAILVSSSQFINFRFIILCFVLSITFSFISLIIQKELHRSFAIKSRQAVNNAATNANLPDSSNLRTKSKWCNNFTYLSLLFFLTGFVLILIFVFY